MNALHRVVFRGSRYRRVRRVLRALCALALLLAFASPGASLAQSKDAPASASYPRYRLVDLGPSSGLFAESTQLNNRGQMVAQRSNGVPDPYPVCINENCIIWTGVIVQADGTVTDLGALPGVNNSAPTWIDESGLIAGISQNGAVDPLTGFPEVRAVLWSREHRIEDLGTLGGNSSQAIGVNSRGQVVGVALNAVDENPDFASLIAFGPSATQARAFLWQRGLMQDLGTLGGNDAAAWGVNERGQVVGLSYTNATPSDALGVPTIHPFLWENGTMRDLGSLGGTVSIPGSFALAFLSGLGGGTRLLNDSGEVAGTSTLEGDEVWHAFLWSHGKMTDLGTLGGSTSDAVAISDKGQVVGRAVVTDTPLVRHAFLWEKGRMMDLGAVAPCTRSTAQSINSSSQIVGGLGACAPTFVDERTWFSAFYVEKGKPMVDLNTLITPASDIHLTDAFIINERGEISAGGVGADGSAHAVLLVPLPGR